MVKMDSSSRGGADAVTAAAILPLLLLFRRIEVVLFRVLAVAREICSGLQKADLMVNEEAADRIQGPSAFRFDQKVSVETSRPQFGGGWSQIKTRRPRPSVTEAHIHDEAITEQHLYLEIHRSCHPGWARTVLRLEAVGAG